MLDLISDNTFDKFFSTKILFTRSQAKLISYCITEHNNKCNLLFWGFAKFGKFWSEFNTSGYNLFMEYDKNIKIDKINNPLNNIYKFNLDTSVKDSLLNFENHNIPNPPDILFNKIWDIIIIDGPPGFSPASPGRALPIIWSSYIATDYTHIFVHDYQRELEKKFTDKYLGQTTQIKDILHNEDSIMAWRLPKK